jgi:ribonuclease VapC
VVLDASAVLVYLQGEPGRESVEQALETGAVISSANLAEVLSKVVDVGLSPMAILVRLRALGCTIEPLTEDDALQIGALRATTRQHGLSLGVRACLALGIRLAQPILTADRAWATLTLPIHIQLVR